MMTELLGGTRKKPLLLLLTGFVCVMFGVQSAQAEQAAVSWSPNSEADLLGYKVYYGTSSRNYQSVVDVGNVLEYDVTNLLAGNTYYFAVTAYDSARNESDFSEEAFITFATDTPPAPLVTDVVILNRNSIRVNYDQEMDPVSVTDKENYQISPMVQIASVTLDSSKTFVILSTATHEVGLDYSLTIRNVANHSKIPIEQPFVHSYRFDAEISAPQVTDAVILSRNSIRVYYSQKMDPVSVTRKENYQISPAVQITTVDLDSSRMFVTLNTATHVVGLDYSLTIRNVANYSNIPIAQPFVHSYRFDAEISAPQVTDAVILSRNSIRVYYSQKMDPVSVTTKENYQISPAVQITTVGLDSSRMFVTLNTASHEIELDYSLTIGNVANYSNIPIAQPFVHSYRFDAETGAPQVTDVVMLSRNSIRVYYSQQMDPISVTSKENYQISPEVQIASVDIDSSRMFVTLSTASHEIELDYSLTIRNVANHANIPIAQPFVHSYRFNVEISAPQLSDLVFLNRNTIRIYYSQRMDRISATKKENYRISPDVQIISAELGASQMFVELITSTHKIELDYTITIRNVANYSNITLEQPFVRTYRFPDTFPPFVTGINLIDLTTIEIFYSEEMNSTSIVTVGNYSIVPALTISGIHANTAKNKVILRTAVHSNSTNYVLTIRNVSDQRGNALTSEFSITYSFVQQEAPTVVDVQLPNRQSIEVIYSKKMDHGSVADRRNYSIQPLVQIHDVLVDDNRQKVTLLTDEHEVLVSYKLTVAGVKDISQKELSQPYEYSYSFSDNVAPHVVRIDPETRTSLKIYFSEEMDVNSLSNRSNYEISPSIEVKSLSVDESGLLVGLETSEHDYSVWYKMGFESIVDLAGNPLPENYSISYKFNTPVMVDSLSNANYQTAQLSEGDTYFVDRQYQLASIPAVFQEVTWIKTANDDKFSVGDEFLRFRIRETSQVFVAYDTRLPQLPGWLNSWTQTAYAITDQDGNSYRCLGKVFQTGNVVLGGNYGTDTSNMYLVLVKSVSGNEIEISEPEDEVNADVPETYVLDQNYPNPFNGYTEISFDAKQAGSTGLVIYDLLGKEVRRLEMAVPEPGRYHFVWNGRNEYGTPVSSGVYMYRIKSEKDQVSRKMTLLR